VDREGAAGAIVSGTHRLAAAEVVSFHNWAIAQTGARRLSRSWMKRHYFVGDSSISRNALLSNGDKPSRWI
jgi:hypothetical protein